MTDERAIYLRLCEGQPLPNINSLRHFRAVVILEGSYSNHWQDEVSRWLVASGCLYMMARGPNCSSWDDSVDHAMIQKYPDDAPDEQFVLTTWHQDETLEEVFWFAQFCAHDPYDMIEHTLLVHIANHDKESELLTLFEQSKSLVEREDEKN